MTPKLHENSSLGILAGGRASRLNGADKAFIRYQNEFLSQRILMLLDARFAAQYISARGPDKRFSKMNLQPVFDQRSAFSGPLAGLEALLEATQSEYLLTIPVDVKFVPAELIHEWLDKPEQPGMVLRDQDGLQPLLALWHVATALPAVKLALDQNEKAVYPIISLLNFKITTRTDIKIGNLNTPEDFKNP